MSAAQLSLLARDLSHLLLLFTDVAGDFGELLADVGNFCIPASDAIVLVVDDETSILATLERFLRRKGFVILTAESTEDALEVLETDCKPHVVLTDKNLPKADGLELIRKGKTIAPDASFILMTGYATIESSIEALDLGAVGYLQKPFDLKKVLAMVELALEKNADAHRHRMLIDRLRTIHNSQATVIDERDRMKEFVDTQVKKLLAELGTEFSNVNDSMEAILRFSEAISSADGDSTDAETAIKAAIDGWKRATVAVAEFAETHRGLAQPTPAK